jgi:hypothetical protein
MNRRPSVAHTTRRVIVLTDVFTNDRHSAAAGFTPLF